MKCAFCSQPQEGNSIWISSLASETRKLNNSHGITTSDTDNRQCWIMLLQWREQTRWAQQSSDFLAGGHFHTASAGRGTQILPVKTLNWEHRLAVRRPKRLYFVRWCIEKKGATQKVPELPRDQLELNTNLNMHRVKIHKAWERTITCTLNNCQSSQSLEALTSQNGKTSPNTQGIG